MILAMAGCLVDSDLYERRKVELSDLDGDGFRPIDGDCDDVDADVNLALPRSAMGSTMTVTDWQTGKMTTSGPPSGTRTWTETVGVRQNWTRRASSLTVQLTEPGTVTIRRGC